MSRDTFDPDGPSVDTSPTAAPPEAVAPPSPDTDFGRLHPVSRDNYEILAEFARGGLGRVLRARDRRIDRIVAIKETLRQSPALHARFAREAFVTAHLQHPAIVPVYEVGRWIEGGQPFYAMKLVAGAALEDALRNARSLRARLALLPHAIAVADALAYAHDQRVIHRDLKPANVLIGDFGETVVIDWGLAKRLDHADDRALPDEQVDPGSGRTLAGAVLGTPGYMAPEQARGEEVDARVDVYALGAMLYELLSGVRPYAECAGMAEILAATLAGPPTALQKLEPTLAPELVTIVQRAMAQEPRERYPAARGLADDLRRFQTGQLVGAHRYTLGELLGRWVRRHYAVLVASAVAAAVLVAGGFLSVVSIVSARDRAEAAQDVAEARLVTLYTESARLAWVAGDPLKALAYLPEAMLSSHSTPDVAFLAARATEAIAAADKVMVGHVAPVLYVGWSPDGADLLSSGGDLYLARWDARTGEKRWLKDLGTASAWSPDGRALYSVKLDGKISTWTPDGDPVREIPFLTPEGGADTARRIVPSPDGAYVAAVGQEGAVIWWDAASGAVLGRVRASAGRALALAWTPDGSALLAGGDGGRVSMWSRADAEPLGSWALHEGAVEVIRVSPDGTRAVSGGDDGAVVLLDLTTRGIAARLVGHTAAVTDAAFDATGTRLATTSKDHTARTWTVGPSPTPVAVATSAAAVNFVAWTWDSLLTAGEDGAIEWWDAAGRRTARYVGHTNAIAAMALSPDGRQLATAGLDQYVRTWNLDTPATFRRLDVGGTAATRGVVARDGSSLLVATKDGARLFAADGALLHHLGGPVEAVSVAWSADRVATASADATIHTWDPKTGVVLLTLHAAGGRARWVGFSPDGARLVTVEGDGKARVRDATTGVELAALGSARGPIRAAPWSPDGARIVTTVEGPGATLWDTTTFTAVAEIPVLATESYAAAWSADGARFLLTTDGADVVQYLASDGSLERVYTGHAMGPIAAAAFSPDGKTALTAGFDGTARTWDTATGALRFTVGDATNPVLGAAFRPDGAVFVTAGGGGDVSAWSTRTGQRLQRWTDVPASPVAVSFSPAGEALLVVGLDGPPVLLPTTDWADGPLALQRRVACEVPWRLDAGVLVASYPINQICR